MKPESNTRYKHTKPPSHHDRINNTGKAHEATTDRIEKHTTSSWAYHRHKFLLAHSSVRLPRIILSDNISHLGSQSTQHIGQGVGRGVGRVREKWRVDVAHVTNVPVLVRKEARGKSEGQKRGDYTYQSPALMENGTVAPLKEYWIETSSVKVVPQLSNQLVLLELDDEEPTMPQTLQPDFEVRLDWPYCDQLLLDDVFRSS